ISGRLAAKGLRVFRRARDRLLVHRAAAFPSGAETACREAAVVVAVHDLRRAPRDAGRIPSLSAVGRLVAIVLAVDAEAELSGEGRARDLRGNGELARLRAFH